MKRTIVTLGIAIGIAATSYAQSRLNQHRNEEFEAFRREIHADFDNFRQQIMADYVEFARIPWKEFKESAPLPKPDPEPVPPVVIEDDQEDEPVEDKPVVIEEVITPIQEEPQPTPVQPIEDVPVIMPTYLDFTVFGTPMKVRYEPSALPKLKGLTEANIADALMALSKEENDNTIADCLQLRADYDLCDWAYLQMLRKLSEAATDNTNDATLLTAYLYMNSGYKMRLAHDGNNLHMLYASKHTIYEVPWFDVDGERYYVLGKMPERIFICQASYPKEKALSLLVTKSQKFSRKESSPVNRVSKRYPDMKASVSVNMNLLDFYSSYPTSFYDDNVVTRWAQYANTPLDAKVADQFYPYFRKQLEGKSNRDAVNALLNFVQTGFVYEYDDKVWGGDRAFFAEESLYYPYCDCEDRSILFTRMVRDLLGLRCLLVFYPGHLAAAVELKDDTPGDYIMLDGHKFIITDPTYINAPSGKTMPKMDNQTAKVIVLK